MAPDKKNQPVDDDLLANAIPIEEIEEIEAVPATSKLEPEVPKPIDLDEAIQVEHREIRTFDTHKMTDVSDTWKRRPAPDTHGATHARTFVAKLRQDAIEHLDHQVNEWLDQHPEFTVKFSTVTTGILSGKLREEALFMTVWV